MFTVTLMNDHTLNGQNIPQADDAKYLGLHLNHKLN